MLDNLRFDLTSAVRGLKATPVPVTAAVATLAVAIGMNLAMVGLVDRALLSPPPHIVAPQQVFTLTFGVRGDANARMTTTSFATFADIREGVPALAAAAAWQRVSTSVVIAGEQTRADVMLVSGAYFGVLGARPIFGRGILEEDDRQAASAPVAVLSHGFWKAAFGGARDVLGRHFTIRGLDYSVAGVMPADFSGHSAATVDVWVPFAAAMRNTPGWDRDRFRNVASIVVRVDPGANAATAASQASAAVDRDVALVPLGGANVSSAERRITWWLAGVAALVLIIGMANAGTLLLVRGATRARDAAIRTALGASRTRLLRQAWLEATILALIAITTSLGLAYWFEEAVRGVLLPGVAASEQFRASTLMTAAVAGLVAAITAAIAGVLQLPATLRPDNLNVAGRSSGRRPRIQSTLLLVQTTLSVLLLAGAGMFGRSLYNLATQELGLRMDGVIIVDFEQGPDVVAGQNAIYETALERVRLLPGVESATVISSLPFGNFHVPPISVPGLSGPPSVNGQLPFLNAATPEFLDILEVEVVEGRRFTQADERGAPVVIVNQTMARTIWPGQSALGKCIRIGFDPDFDPLTSTGPPTPSAAVPCREVIGIARDVRQRSLLPTGIEDRLMQYFVPFSQIPGPPKAVGDGPHISGLLLRASGDSDALTRSIRRIVVGGRTHLPFVRVRPYAQLLDRQMRPWRLGTALLGLFGAIALGVAAVGLYAAFTHAVSERRREMAIRIAVGARPARVMRMILCESLTLAGCGILGGCVASLITGRWIQSLLFGTAPSDPLVLASAAAVMLSVATLATFFPARTASKADPNALLRSE